MRIAMNTAAPIAMSAAAHDVHSHTVVAVLLLVECVLLACSAAKRLSAMGIRMSNNTRTLSVLLLHRHITPLTKAYVFHPFFMLPIVS